MELDFSEEWRILRAAEAGLGEASGGSPAAFAAAELAAVLSRAGCRPPAPGGEESRERIIVLHSGQAEESRARRFSWRASEDRAEIYGTDEASLLRGVYDFLRALGCRWPAPGEGGERLPKGPVLSLESRSRSSGEAEPPPTLVLGHGAFLERYDDYLRWAARTGYSSVLIRLTRNPLALEGAPEELYEALRTGIAELARRLGLSLELGGEFIGGGDPGLGAEAFAEYAAAHPEIEAFHDWPEGPWSGAAVETRAGRAETGGRGGPRSLNAARAYATALERARPDAALSFLAEELDERLAEAIREARSLPPSLGLTWAPRCRAWDRALGDAGSAENTARLARFASAAEAWRSAGGGPVALFGRYEDGFLFKGAVPPLASVIGGDLAACRRAPGKVDSVGLVCGGGRLPLGLRPNSALLPALAADAGLGAEAAFDEWAKAAYGSAAAPMRDYWRELGAAWSVDLDLAEGETAVRAPGSPALAAADPPADWGDPREASAERLAAKRDRCEELFDHLRRAEAALAEARKMAAPGLDETAVRDEADEYAVSGSVLELNCARLSAYHELAAGDGRAAADIANLALSASAALRKALGRLPDPRARRETRFAVDLFYELRLRQLRRANARSAIRRLLDLWYSRARIATAARRASRAYEPKRRIS
jgi:hypothetical protein